MTGSGDGELPGARIVRARRGRLLGGVCAGLPESGGLGTNGLRLLFVIATLFGGIGVIAYLACWLVIPSEDQDPDSDPVRSVVVLAWATGGLVVLVLLGATAAVATVFGLGWIVFALAALVAGLMFSPLRSRIPTVAALLALSALALPAMAVALSPLRLTFQSGQSIVAPRTYRALARNVYRSGFGTLMIDLRRTPVFTGAATLRIDAGLRRTIVALPADRCIRVRVNYAIHLFPAHLAALVTGHETTPFHDVVLFGHPYGYGADGGPRASVSSKARTDGPLLIIDFTSQGGGLYVRDYPDDVDPELLPQWPGYPVTLEWRPYLSNEPRRLRGQLLRQWRRRLRYERASQLEVDRNMLGPCVGATRVGSGPAQVQSTGAASSGSAGQAVSIGGSTNNVGGAAHARRRTLGSA